MIEFIREVIWKTQATRGPAELADPCWRLDRLQETARHAAASKALDELNELICAPYSSGPKILHKLRRAHSLVPGPARKLSVGGVCID